MDNPFSFLSGSLALENRPFHFQVSDVVLTLFNQCHGYLAYKLTTLGRASDDDVPSFIIVSKEHGIILLDVLEERVVDVIESGGVEFWRLDNGELITSRSWVVDIYEEEVRSRLKNDLSLYDRKTRNIRVPITSAVLFCSNQASEAGLINQEESASEVVFFEDLQPWLSSIEHDFQCSDEQLGRIFSLLEGTFVYEEKKSAVEEPLNTINDYIQKSLRTTFKQDDAQRLAAMQLPPGPQRIRGLAGTGKTIVLCLKAAITHKKFSDYKILYLFNTQSLYSHVQNLISRYYTLEAKKAPDFDEKLHVFHAWGGKQRPGLYSTLCQKLGITPLTWSDTRGHRDQLGYIYKDLLSRMGDKIKPEYDLILIDEAQDFSSEIFQVAYKLAKGEGANKRIIWAYDEFQSLKDTLIKGPAELFGETDGEPNLPNSVLHGKYPGEIPKDFVLPNCYRTPRPVLMTAHGVAMGLYSNRQSEMFYLPGDWKAIGYQVIEPRSLMISEGENVVIERPDANSRNLLEGILLDNSKRPLNLVRTEVCFNDEAQLSFVASKVKQLVFDEGVSPEEIVIINLISSNNKNQMLAIQRALMQIGVRSVIPGYVESSDVFKPKGFVTISTPFRAKGNEANIVFVINAHRLSNDFTLRMRNAFFVAVTRSRGWCYISGVGAGMEPLVSEIEAIKRDFPRFCFICPSREQVDSSKTFLGKSDKELDEIQRLVDLVDQNPELRALLLRQPDEK